MNLKLFRSEVKIPSFIAMWRGLLQGPGRTNKPDPIFHLKLLTIIAKPYSEGSERHQSIVVSQFYWKQTIQNYMLHHIQTMVNSKYSNSSFLHLSHYQSYITHFHSIDNCRTMRSSVDYMSNISSCQIMIRVFTDKKGLEHHQFIPFKIWPRKVFDSEMKSNSSSTNPLNTDLLCLA